MTNKNKKIKIIFTLLLSMCLVVYFYKQLLNPSFFDADDYNHHAVRTANYYLALKQGQLPVRWGPNLNEGYGYPTFNYTYHFPYMVSVLFYIFGFSIQQSVNLSMLIAVLIANLSSFLLIFFISKSKMFAFLGSLFFVLNPIILLNVFWRGAIGEMYFIAFIPLFFLAIEMIFDFNTKKNKFLAGLLLSLSLSIMIISHVPSILLLAFLAVPYLIYKFTSNSSKSFAETKRNIFIIFFFSSIACLITAWYFLPAFFEKKYISYDSGQSLIQYRQNFIKLGSLLDISRKINTSDQFLQVFQFGPAIILIFISAFLTLFFKKHKEKTKLILFIALFLLSIFLTNSLSQWFWQNSNFLQMIQYPWRILWINVFISLYLLTILIGGINRKKQFIIFLTLFILTIYSALGYSNRKQMEYKSDYEWFEMTTTGTSFNEHQPIWSKMPYVFPDDILLLSIDQINDLNLVKDDNQLEQLVQSYTDYEINLIENNGTKINYQIKTSEDVVAIHKRLYFPGWIIKVDNQPAKIIKDIPHYQGVLALEIPVGEREVLVEFSERTNLRAIAEIISLIAFLLTIGGSIVYLCYYNKLYTIGKPFKTSQQ